MSQYPRPDYSDTPYSKDKGWGIAIIVLSALGICGGVLMLGAGALLGGLGVAAAANGGREGRETAVAVGGIGGFVGILGFAIVACSAIQIAGGAGVMKGRRWGFVLTAVLSAISILLNVPSLPAGIIGVAISAVILYYCYMRLSGKDGPVPV